VFAFGAKPPRAFAIARRDLVAKSGMLLPRLLAAWDNRAKEKKKNQGSPKTLELLDTEQHRFPHLPNCDYGHKNEHYFVSYKKNFVAIFRT
jgi:hypothetical protein